MSRKERLQKLVREYWKAKNRCACYTDMYGTYEDSQMVHWARRAQTLGQQIKELKREERDALV
ncbi:MAG: hypothetical protein J5965_10195 [Aeriscardovia sp.]|nr:hypothetical protein [Aeriscardovia sp.]